MDAYQNIGVKHCYIFSLHGQKRLSFRLQTYHDPHTFPSLPVMKRGQTVSSGAFCLYVFRRLFFSFFKVSEATQFYFVNDTCAARAKHELWLGDRRGTTVNFHSLPKPHSEHLFPAPSSKEGCRKPVLGVLTETSKTAGVQSVALGDVTVGSWT